MGKLKVLRVTPTTGPNLPLHVYSQFLQAIVIEAETAQKMKLKKMLQCENSLKNIFQGLVTSHYLEKKVFT